MYSTINCCVFHIASLNNASLPFALSYFALFKNEYIIASAFSLLWRSIIPDIPLPPSPLTPIDSIPDAKGPLILPPFVTSNPNSFKNLVSIIFSLTANSISWLNSFVGLKVKRLPSTNAVPISPLILNSFCNQANLCGAIWYGCTICDAKNLAFQNNNFVYKVNAFTPATVVSNPGNFSNIAALSSALIALSCPFAKKLGFLPK